MEGQVGFFLLCAVFFIMPSVSTKLPYHGLLCFARVVSAHGSLFVEGKTRAKIKETFNYKDEITE